MFLFFVYYLSDSSCVDQWKHSSSPSRSSNCSTDSRKYRRNRAGSEHCLLHTVYSRGSGRSVATVSDADSRLGHPGWRDEVNPKSRPTFSFFSYATRMCNKLLLPTATIFVFVGHINSLIYFPKMSPPFLTRVWAVWIRISHNTERSTASYIKAISAVTSNWRPRQLAQSKPLCVKLTVPVRSLS